MIRSMQYYVKHKEMAVDIANWLAVEIEKSIRSRGKFTMALAGGSAPIALYQELTKPHYEIRWESCHLFLGDDRCVSFDDDRSNVKMVRENLLNHIPDTVNFYPSNPDLAPAERAKDYELSLKKILGNTASLDVALLGVGPDGHTASLFPNFEVLEEKECWVLETPVAPLNPPVERYTLCYSLLNRSRHGLFFSGVNNKENIFQTLQQNLNSNEVLYPFEKIKTRESLRYCISLDS